MTWDGGTGGYDMGCGEQVVMTWDGEQVVMTWDGGNRWL